MGGNSAKNREEQNCETLYSGHDIVDSNINSQQLWIPTKDLYKIKSIKIHNTNGGRAPENPAIAEELLIVDGY